MTSVSKLIAIGIFFPKYCNARVFYKCWHFGIFSMIDNIGVNYNNEPIMIDNYQNNTDKK